jgi:hypothetical protein
MQEKGFFENQVLGVYVKRGRRRRGEKRGERKLLSNNCRDSRKQKMEEQMVL